MQAPTSSARRPAHTGSRALLSVAAGQQRACVAAAAAVAAQRRSPAQTGALTAAHCAVCQRCACMAADAAAVQRESAVQNGGVLQASRRTRGRMLRALLQVRFGAGMTAISSETPGKAADSALPRP